MSTRSNAIGESTVRAVAVLFSELNNRDSGSAETKAEIKLMVLTLVLLC